MGQTCHVAAINAFTLTFPPHRVAILFTFKHTFKSFFQRKVNDELPGVSFVVVTPGATQFT